METIKELREICQAPRKGTDDWHKKYISRKISIYITWLLLHTPIRANGATSLFAFSGIIAGVIFLGGTSLSFFAGAMMLQLWYTMDMVDGEVARYRGEGGATGRFFDIIVHHMVHPFAFAAMGFGLYRQYGKISIFILGLLAGYSVMMLAVILDAFNSTIYMRIKNKLFSERKFDIQRREENGQNDNPGDVSMVKKIFSILHISCTFPVLMDIITIVSVINLFVSLDLFLITVIFYAIMATFVWMARFVAFIRGLKVDMEYGHIEEALGLKKND